MGRQVMGVQAITGVELDDERCDLDERPSWYGGGGCGLGEPHGRSRLERAGFLQLAYRIVTGAGGPLIRAYLRRRMATGKEDPLRHGERLGVASLPRPAGPVVWFHAASIGESVSILALIRHLLEAAPSLAILVTTGTVTSAAVMTRRLPAGAVHQYVPVDRTAYVERFLDHWRPDLAIWIESELWPNLLWSIGRRGIPAALVNARMSDHSFANWRRVPGFVAPLLARFRVCLAQTDDDAARLRQLGAAGVVCVGNLKFSADPLPADAQVLATLGQAIGSRPVWLLASSHPGEDEIALAVHRRLSAALPDLLTVIAPRHPHRGGAIAELAAAAGLTVGRRSKQSLPGAGDAIHVADTVGEMGIWYRLVPVVCIGGSLVRHGGQNPIEPAQLGCAILFGPHMHNFVAIADELAAAGGCWPVANEDGLAEGVRALLGDPERQRWLASAARVVTERHRQVVERALAALAPVFAEAGLPLAPVVPAAPAA